MSRLGRRRSLTLVATALVALTAPAAAHAATYTVKAGDGACGGADLACGGLVEAAAIAVPGDVFTVATGTYPSPKFTRGGVTINGDLGAVINGTIEFAGPAADGVSKLSKFAISQGTSAAPAVYVSGTSGLELSDSVAVSKDGFGVFITGGSANKIIRTAVATGGVATGAIEVETGPDDPAVGVTVDSSILYGGGAGVRALTRNNEAEALAGRTAGNITLTLRHITAAGSTNGIDLDASNARALLPANQGNITATVSDSLAFNNRVVSFSGTLSLPILGGNTAALTRIRTLESGDPATLFLNPTKGNFRLLPTASAAIGQGGFTAGESTTDIDGEDRSAAPTDLGADEYNNAAPTAKIVLATAVPRTTQPVTFDGRGSSDREGNASIAEYRWRFSDGAAETTAQPFVQHTFANEGDAAAGLVVVDKQGAASTEVAVTFTLVNGTPPGVAIVKPKSKQTFHTYTTTTKTVTKNGKKTKVKTRKRTRIQIAGLSKAKTGTTMQRVLLTLQKTKSTTSTTKCRFYDPKTGLKLVACAKPILITARLVKDSASGEWTYTVPSARPLSTGTWKVSAYGVDSTGAFGNSADPKAASLGFTVKK
jgi:hypothetical protein